MEGLRVRRGGQEFQVEDLEALYRLASEGKLKRSDEVLSARGWVRASDLPQLKARLGADPWDVWRDVDDVDAEAAYQGYVSGGGTLDRGAQPTPPTPPPPVVPARPPAPVVGPAPVAPPQAPVPPDVVVPPAPVVVPAPRPAVRAPGASPGGVSAHSPAHGPAADASLIRPAAASAPHPDLPSTDTGDERGQVIAFPVAAPRRTARPVPTLRERSSPPVPLIRWSWLLLWVGVGLLFLAITWWWIRYNGTTRAGIDAAPPPVAVDAGDGAATATPTPPSPTVGSYTRGSTSPYGAVEHELRGGLVGEVRPVRAPGELGDALLIDLQNLRIDVAAVDAPVTQWSGRGNDVPRTAEVHVTLTSDQEVDRQIAAVALTVGRYKRALRLDIPLVEVVVKSAEGDLRTTIDAKRAEELYVGRITLDQFFLAQKGG